MIKPLGRKTSVQYIIIVTKYIIRSEEVKPVKYCTTTTLAKFLFEYVLMWFWCPKVFMINRGTQFRNETMSVMLEEFQVYHQKSAPYHPQANGKVEAFNKILENVLTRICNAKRNKLNVCIMIVLWAYKMTYKKLIGQNSFRLAYGIQMVMPM